MKQERSRLASVFSFERKARGWTQREMAARMSDLQPDRTPISSSWVARLEIDGNTKGPDSDHLELAAVVFARNPIPGQRAKSREEYATMLFQAAGIGLLLQPVDATRRAAALHQLESTPEAARLMGLFEKADPAARELILNMAEQAVAMREKQTRRRQD